MIFCDLRNNDQVINYEILHNIAYSSSVGDFSTVNVPILIRFHCYAIQKIKNKEEVESQCGNNDAN